MYILFIRKTYSIFIHKREDISLPGVSLYDWLVVFGIPLTMCFAFFAWIIIYGTKGEYN